MTTKQIQEQMMREFKTTREVIYEETTRTAQYADSVAEKDAADIAYLAMMLDIDLDDDEEEEEETDDE